MSGKTTSTESTAADRDSDRPGGYALERTASEYDRLRIQAGFQEPATRRALDAIGVAPDMRGLDVGCGPGEGPRLLAEYVGPDGSVTGIDNDPAVAREAKAYVESMTSTRVDVVAADLRDLTEPPGGPFDLITVRLVLMHLPDPVGALRQLHGWLRPGGALLVLEIDARAWAMWPPPPGFPELVRVVLGTLEALGADPRCGIKLPSHFVAAGLGEPAGIDASSVLMPLAASNEICETTYRRMLPAAVRLGLTTEERSQAVLAQMSTVTNDLDRVLVLPQLVAYWTHELT